MIFRMTGLVRMVAIVGLFSGLAPHASGENRLAEDRRMGTHCAPLPGDRCKPMIEKWRERGCITEEEMNYGLTVRPMRIPQCADPDGAWLFNSWCYCSCFAKGTKILVEDKVQALEIWRAVEDVAKDVDRYRIVVPRFDARMGAMRFENLEIAQWTEGPEENPLVVIKGSNGRELVITGNHRVVLADGTMVEAADIQVGDILVDQSGVPVTVIEIDMRKDTESVYNFLTVGSSSISNSHVMFAEGFLVGDLLWENSPDEDVAAFKFSK